MTALVVLVVVAACWPTSVALHERWLDGANPGDTHGYLIVAVSAFLLWRARTRTALLPAVGGGWRAVAALGVAGAAWAFGVRSGILAIEFALFPILVWLAIRAALGSEVASGSRFAVAYLYFAMPLWGFINPVLQWGTVYVVRALLRLCAIPSHFVGNMVQIPAGSFEIAGGCSGLHFFVVALAVAALLGEVRGDGWRGRIKLLLLAGFLAVLSNWLRVFTIILAGHYTHMQHYLVARSHYGYGWWLFGAAMLVLFMLERRMPLSPFRARPSPAASAPASVATTAGSWMSVVAVLVLITAWQWLAARPALASTPQPVVSNRNWVLRDVSPGDWTPVVEGADIHVHGSYSSGTGEVIDRHEFVFLSQRQGKELGGYNDDLLGGAALSQVRGGRLGPVKAAVHESQDRDGMKWVVAVSYRAAGRNYGSPVAAQARHAMESLLHLHSSRASVEIWRAPCISSCRDAEDLIAGFIMATHKKD